MMKVSYCWLSEYVDLTDITPETVASLLTFAGVEVESITPLAKGTGLVIGEIISCKPHPDSDHLHILEVNEGEKYGIVQIVCGAPNARVGLRVIVARAGAVLPEITIHPSKIRGVESNGMCCSLLELGVERKYLSEKQISGIEELPVDAPIGEERVLEYLMLDDVTLDLKLLANRPDLNSLMNVAKEVSTLVHRSLHLPSVPSFGTSTPEVQPVIECSSCMRFSLAEAYGVKVAPSPLWLQRRLMASGVRSINNVVDVGNYAMILTGQPFNMYDKDLLPGNTLVAREDITGPWLAMDDKEYVLEKGDLSIASEGRTMCLGGIMTSKECAVSENSKNIVVESALFSGVQIRHTSSRLGLASESSARFVKGLSDTQEESLAYAMVLLGDLTNADHLSKMAFVGQKKKEEKIIQTSLEAINRRLGTSFSLDEVISTLESEQFFVEKKEEKLFVHVPRTRIDVDGEADISEEVIRLRGYEEVPEHEISLPGSGGYSENQNKERAIRRYLRHIGLNEVLTYSLLSQSENETYPYLMSGTSYQVMNPLTEERAYYRHSLAPSLLSLLSYNASRQQNDFSCFEISEVAVEGKREKHLGIALMGEEEIVRLLSTRKRDFYDAKGILEGILSLLGVKENRLRYEPIVTTRKEFHPGRSALCYLGKELIAVLGELHPAEKKKRGVKDAVMMEIRLSTVLSNKGSTSKAIIPPRYPMTRRDLALVVDEKISFKDLKEVISKSSSLVKEVVPFDVYRGVGVEKGKKSIAIALFIQNENKTMTEEEIQTVVDEALLLLKTKLSAEIRQ